MRHQTLDFETRFVAEGSEGQFQGYASIFNEVDRLETAMKRGAFRRSIAAHVSGRSPVAMLWSHDPATPIGVWSTLAEDEQGLKVAGKLVLGTERGREIHEFLKAGAVTGLSVSFRVRSAERGPKNIPVFTDVDLYEISLVAVPAVPRARVTTVRGLRGPAALRTFTHAVRAAAQSLR